MIIDKTFKYLSHNDTLIPFSIVMIFEPCFREQIYRQFFLVTQNLQLPPNLSPLNLIQLKKVSKK